MQNKRFQKRVEDFICEKCGNRVEGKGYTDHCPQCLWSKHVDINPGDRLSKCNGLMEPIGITVKNDKYIIYYRCTKCGFEHRVKSAPDDNFDEIIKIANRPLKK
jgi:rubrerythrin